MRKILVVDDDPLSREFVSEFLGAKGYSVLTSASAEEALQAVKLDPPNLILMDVLLPNMDGMDATRALKADPASHKIPVIATTALAMPGDQERILSAGYDAHLVKPLDLSLLLGLLEQHLGTRPLPANELSGSEFGP